MIEDEDLLMAMLNSTPVTDGVPADHLGGPAGDELVARFGGLGTGSERRHLRYARDALQALVRGDADATARLGASMRSTTLVPEVTTEGVEWKLEAPGDERLAARLILAWSRVARQMPGRLRPCANTECHLFLLDHSRPGTAKWCSMATCGNRMKVRAHAERTRIR